MTPCQAQRLGILHSFFETYGLALAPCTGVMTHTQPWLGMTCTPLEHNACSRRTGRGQSTCSLSRCSVDCFSCSSRLAISASSNTLYRWGSRNATANFRCSVSVLKLRHIPPSHCGTGEARGRVKLLSLALQAFGESDVARAEPHPH